MYRNLEAELKRKGLTRDDVATALNINISTVSAKLTKPNRLKYSEAKKIKETFFNEENFSIEYLFG